MSSSGPETIILPAPHPNQTYVTISALEAGHLTLPENLFVTSADPEKRSTVPSLAFLIQHPSPSTTSPSTTSPSTTSPSTTSPSTTSPSTISSTPSSKLVFDLGLKRDFSGYRSAQQHHISQRQPTIVSPDCAESLLKGGLSPSDIDTIILSHVHWDHIGTPSDFTNADFVVGSGTLHLLANGGGPFYPAEIFNPDELPRERTTEFPAVRREDEPKAFERQTNHKWFPLSSFPAVIDFFGDASLYVADAPGHLYGHVNLLARTGPRKWVYLGGDCCHDSRILRGERGIALYDDGRGRLRSVHVDTEVAGETVRRVSGLLRKGRVREESADGGSREVDVEVVVAHDAEWREANQGRFWPGHL